MTKPTLTIGIPAYNEEANIKYLLLDLLNQKTDDFILEQIIVVDDFSSDNTIAEIRKIKSKKINVLASKSRKGRSFRLNQIIKLVNSDVLVILDADTSIKDKAFLSKLIKPIVSEKADLTSVQVEELPAANFVEEILDTSMKIKKNIFENHKNGNNIYTCHGRARGFSKNFYKSLKFAVGFGEDAFSYLFCIKNNFKYAYVSNTKIFYRLPDNLTDHQKQSTRFLKSQIELGKKFGESYVVEKYRIPSALTIKAINKYILKRPLAILAYFGVLAYMKFIFMFQNVEATWNISSSTKRRIFGLFFLGYETE